MKNELRINVSILLSQLLIAVLLLKFSNIKTLDQILSIVTAATFLAFVASAFEPLGNSKNFTIRTPYAFWNSAISLSILLLLNKMYLCLINCTDMNIVPGDMEDFMFFAYLILLVVMIYILALSYRNLYHKVSSFDNGKGYPIAYILCTLPYGIGVVLGGVLCLISHNTEIDWR